MNDQNNDNGGVMQESDLYKHSVHTVSVPICIEVNLPNTVVMQVVRQNCICHISLYYKGLARFFLESDKVVPIGKKYK
jgi:hypothetical protein